jgi:hypothetical protein
MIVRTLSLTAVTGDARSAFRKTTGRVEPESRSLSIGVREAVTRTKRPDAHVSSARDLRAGGNRHVYETRMEMVQSADAALAAPDGKNAPAKK